MSGDLRDGWRSFSPAARFFIATGYALAAFFVLIYCLMAYREVSLQRAVASNYGETAGYLVPVDCEAVPPGERSKDYVRGYGPAPRRHATGKPVCFYNAMAFDRLFVSAIQGERHAVHLDQAQRIKVDLLVPDATKKILPALAFLPFSAIALLFLLTRKIKQAPSI